MYNEYSNSIVTDCNFISNGTGMGNDNSSPIVTGCIFTDNGCGMGNGESNPIVTNCTFTDNIFGMSNYMSNPEVTNCTFSDNSNLTDNYDGTGAGMHNYQSSPVITDCNFIGNSADYGGGMFNKWYSEPVLINCVFTGNYGRFSGGGMCSSREPQDGSTKPILNDCTFSNNSADGYGGGISGNQSEPNLTDCEFTGNTARNGGGGMYNRADCMVSMVNCTFTENSQTREGPEYGGGAIFNDRENTLILDGCAFTQNWAQGEGGGGIQNGTEYYGSSNIMTLRNCHFFQNTAYGGGGIENLGELNLSNCTFTENRCFNALGDGGAISSGGMLTIDNCIFSKNSSRDEEDGYGGFGGAIFCDESEFKISNSIFIDNTSLCDEDMVIDHHWWEFCAGCGGAVCIFYSPGVIDSCLFAGNSSGIAGGLYLESTFESEDNVILNNCTIVGNYARYYGGGLLLDYSVDVTNCIIRDNRAQLGSQVATWWAWEGESRISYCDVQGGEEDVFLWDIWGEALIDWGEGNIDADPCFVGAGWWDPNGTPTDPNDDFWVHGDYHLSWLSPCVNAGDPYGDYTGQRDMDGQPRVRYGRVDIGAY